MKNLTHNFLLVDDNMATNFLNKNVIEKSGLSESVSIALNGAEAINSIKANTPSFIFLDINMPIMNGWEFLEAFQKLKPELKKCAIILMLGEKLNAEKQAMVRTRYELIEYDNKILNNTFLYTLINTKLLNLA